MLFDGNLCLCRRALSEYRSVTIDHRGIECLATRNRLAVFVEYVHHIILIQLAPPVEATNIAVAPAETAAPTAPEPLEM